MANQTELPEVDAGAVEMMECPTCKGSCVDPASWRGAKHYDDLAACDTCNGEGEVPVNAECVR